MAPEQPTSSPDTTAPDGLVVPEERLQNAVEAILMASDRPLGASRIAKAIGLETEEDAKKTAPAIVREHIDALNGIYEESERSFRIEEVAGGYRMMTLPDYAPAVGGLYGLRDSQKLTRAALETLAIIAYRQPVTRAQLETIRGVGCGEVVRSLLEKRMIAIVGRAEELGRPMLYGTSKRFLEVFGLGSLRDLPAVADILPPQLDQPAPAPATAEDASSDATDAQPDAEVAVEAKPIVTDDEETPST